MGKGLELLCDSRHGVMIPVIMIYRLQDAGWSGISDADAEDIKNGSYDENYWETWAHILDNATFIDEDGYTWRLYQDGDLWAYCDELMTDEEKYNFFGEY